MKRMLKLKIATSFIALLIGAQSVVAADFGGTALRGSIQPQGKAQSTEALWDGFYIGGTGGYGAASASSSKTAQSLVAGNYYGTEYQNKANPSASSFVNVSKMTTQGLGAGGIIGYNTTWEDVVVGVEADYTRYNLRLNSTFDTGWHVFDTGRTIKQGSDTNPIAGNFSITGRDSTKITDVVTVRGRAGYAMGSFMPFMTAGLAVGHGERATNITAQDYYSTVTGPITAVGTSSKIESNKDRFVTGVALGLGFDYAITSNLFLRAEYQYIKFGSFGGANVAISNARTGIAAKF